MEWNKLCDLLLWTSVLLLVGNYGTTASREFSARPVLKVSDKTQPLPLVEEVPDEINLPAGRDLNPKRLRRKLGVEFDEQWMSIDEPSPTSLVASSGVPTNDTWLMKELHALNISQTFSPLLTEQLHQWLLAKAGCPVVYQWTYVGPLFWPPWVKRGTCPENKSCSWPSGMRCLPGQQPHILRLMRWHCRPTSQQSSSALREDSTSHTSRDGGGSSRSRKVKCKWLQVPFPVSAECVCSCT